MMSNRIHSIYCRHFIKLGFEKSLELLGSRLENLGITIKTVHDLKNVCYLKDCNKFTHDISDL